MAGFYENSGDPGNTFGAAAKASAEEARSWAVTDENTLVPKGNGTDQFSALHYASKAALDLLIVQTSKTDAQTAASEAATSATASGVSETNSASSATDSSDKADESAASAVLAEADRVSTVANVALTDANVVLTNADVVTTANNVTTTNNNVTATNADVTNTNADVVLTNADVVSTSDDSDQTALDRAAASSSASAAASSVASVKAYNYIINGTFDHWNYATSQTANGYGSDDRWVNEHNNSTKTSSQQSFALGQTEVPNNPKYFSRTTVSSNVGSNNYVIKRQRIEFVRSLSGKTATLVFYAKAETAKNIAIEFKQFFGSGGSPSTGIVSIGVTTFNLTTSFQKFTATVSIPSISGKSIGSDSNDFLDITFWLDAGSNYNSRTNSLGQQSGTFDIAEVSLIEGPVDRPALKRSFGQELSLCERYFTKLNLTIYSSVYNVTQRVHWFFKTTMRAQPTITLAANSAAAAQGVSTQALEVANQNEAVIAVNSTADAEL